MASQCEASCSGTASYSEPDVCRLDSSSESDFSEPEEQAQKAGRVSLSSVRRQKVLLKEHKLDQRYSKEDSPWFTKLIGLRCTFSVGLIIFFCFFTNKYIHIICACSSCVLIGVPSYRRLLLFAFEPSEACSRYIISGLCVLALPPFHAFSHLTSQMFNVSSSLRLILPTPHTISYRALL